MIDWLWNTWKIKTNCQCFLLEVGKVDELDFRVKIQMPYHASQKFEKTNLGCFLVTLLQGGSWHVTTDDNERLRCLGESPFHTWIRTVQGTIGAFLSFWCASEVKEVQEAHDFYLKTSKL